MKVHKNVQNEDGFTPEVQAELVDMAPGKDQAERVFLVKGAVVVVILLFLVSNFGMDVPDNILLNKTCTLFKGNSRCVDYEFNMYLHLWTQYLFYNTSVDTCIHIYQKKQKIC